MSKEKIAIAYSGGLDTSIMIKWLKEKEIRFCRSHKKMYIGFP